MKTRQIVAVVALACSIACFALSTAVRSQGQSPSPYFSHHFVVGEHFSNVFSIAISVVGSGFPESVDRGSGSATYIVKSANDKVVILSGRYRYDGGRHGAGNVVLDAASYWPIRKGVMKPDTDASGFTFNTAVWGELPANPIPGSMLTVHLLHPWELGPAGAQQVRVVSTVPASGTVTLERTGSGAGPIRMDRSGYSISLGGKTDAKVVPTGTIRWRGFTTISRGIVLADSLLAERDVKLLQKNGRTLAAKERMIMLLNAVPGDT